MIIHGKTILRTVLQSRHNVLRSTNPIRAMSTAEQPSSEDVLFGENGNAGMIIFNRPKLTNAISHTMILAMTKQFQIYEKYKPLIITKTNIPKVFCAGGDFVEVFKRLLKKDRTALLTLRMAYEMPNIIKTARVPYVALIDGVTMGGGVGMSVFAKYCICTENTEWAMPEIRVGLCCDVGASYFLSRMKNHVGFYLGLTATRVKGYDNVHAGSATHFCESAKLPELEKALTSTNDIEGTVNSFCSKPDNATFSLEPHLEKIDRIFRLESAEEIIDELEGDGSAWAKKSAAIMRAMCPLSLKATLHNLHLGKKSTLHECLQNEWTLANSFFQGPNFKEGVRAFMKDKDNKPKWIPQKLEDVTPQMVEDLYKVERFLGPLTLRPPQ